MMYHESRRMVIGLAELLKIAVKNEYIGKKLDAIFCALLFFSKSCFIGFEAELEYYNGLSEYERELDIKSSKLNEWSELMSQPIQSKKEKIVENNDINLATSDIENEPNLLI